MYEPERPIDPPEAKVLLTCDICGCDICEGDEYYELPGELFDIACEDCATAWMNEHKKTAEKEERDDEARF